MRFILTLMTIVMLPIGASAQLDPSRLPAGSQWYLHIDFEAMRESSVGKPIYDWMNRELFDELASETGFNVDKELDQLTAYSSAGDEATLIMHGNMSADSRDRLLAALAVNGNTEAAKSGEMNYFRIEDIDIQNNELQIDTDVLFVTFDRRKTWILSSSLEDLEAVFRGKQHDTNQAGALMVLSANNSLLQAGVNAETMSDQWDSGMLRNTRQIAFRLADSRGEADILARITAKDETTSNALASIVRGLIGLQTLSSDTDSDISEVLGKIQVDSDRESLTLRLTVAAETIVGAFED